LDKKNIERKEGGGQGSIHGCHEQVSIVIKEEEEEAGDPSLAGTSTEPAKTNQPKRGV
jgi:hypothetical protein